MKSGYKILWTDHALAELEDTLHYLQENFSEKELKKLSHKLENIINLLAARPLLFPLSDIDGIRRVSILRHNTLYYRIGADVVEIVSFFSNRQNPAKRKM